MICCPNCSKELSVKEVKKGATVLCDCGCLQKCLDANEHLSRWRVMNPFDFEDKRAK